MKSFFLMFHGFQGNLKPEQPRNQNFSQGAAILENGWRLLAAIVFFHIQTFNFYLTLRKCTANDATVKSVTPYANLTCYHALGEQAKRSHIWNTPTVKWAQRRDHLLVTIEVDNIQGTPDFKLDENRLHFKAVGGSDKKTYEVTINFKKEIEVKDSTYSLLPNKRNIPMKIMKKEPEFWPCLTSDTKKPFWLKTDFNQWRDEDDSDDGDDDPYGSMAGGNRFEDMMAQMGAGGFDPAGMDAGMGDADAEDSDDEPLPDLEEDKDDEK